ncbi:Acyl-CoA dehydrogenase, C-terminal domain [Fictibacillus solisalsi]|uniref:Acyl-CoA dehydrogenase, C-terminal domain n=1 Tax=Fictibacillus solisalsi TaxID=459525 RepID=A0A1H0BTJ0_9BACL|nr:acyl-CoA dehydrogenase family protein [Fictibacillus solisalsi]SDN48891.1 Acyl-CoA dehydrogenase, C-terminal domain [Fictibacillus solisalsi]
MRNSEMQDKLNYLKTFDENDIQGKIKYLIDQNFHLLTLDPDITPQKLFYFISNLSSICHNTALCLAMHLYTVWGIRLFTSQNEFVTDCLDQVKEQKKLFASLNEPSLHFIHSKNFKEKDYSITATEEEDGYLINGIKRFVSMEPLVNYLPVYCRLKNYKGNDYGIITLIIPKETKGIKVNQDWDSISMGPSESNSITFEDVFVPKENVILNSNAFVRETDVLGLLFRLAISSVYVGIGERALQYLYQKIRSQRVPHHDKPLAFFPGAQFNVAEMLILNETANSQILELCRSINEYLNSSRSYTTMKELKKKSLITKEYTTISTIKLVEFALKTVGVGGLSSRSPLAKLYQDVLAGPFHPPQKDVLYEIIAKDFLGIVPYKSRW